MARPKPPIVSPSELVHGQHADCFVLLIEKAAHSTREGKPFLTCRFGDRRRSIACVVWSDSPWYEAARQEWRVGQAYKVRCTFAEHEKYGPQIEIHNIRTVLLEDQKDGFDPANLVEQARGDSAAMLAEVRTLAESAIQDLPLRQLTLKLLDDHAAALCTFPATTNKFYPFRGGLLAHTLAVTQNCLWLAQRYVERHPDLKPPLNLDLVVAGAIVHDLGRVREFEVDGLLIQPGVTGKLMGHLFLGRDLLREAASAIPVLDPELLRLLEHMLITHLTLPEWGSPRLPMIPECLILHHADDLDAKMEMYARCLIRDDAPGPFTQRDPILQKQLYKGRSI